MSLWWLQPGWSDATCGRCGVNIASTGGDPDWGLCSRCMDERVESQRAEAEHYAEMEVEHLREIGKEEGA